MCYSFLKRICANLGILRATHLNSMRNLSHTFGRFFVYNLLWVLPLTSCQNPPEYDLLLKDFVLHSPHNAIASHEGSEFWIAVKDGKIASIIDITQHTILPKAKTELSLEGQHLYPGFIDAHGHLFGYARTLSTVNLVGANSKAECIERITSYVETHPNETWIVGRGWDQNDWPEKSFPTASDLDGFEKVKICMTRIDGHAAWVNQAVLDEFNITNDTRIDGGSIIDGVLVDNAETLVQVPKLSNKFWRAALLQAQDSLVKYGLTAMTDAGLSKDQILLLDSLQQEGSFKLFVNAMIK